MYEVEPERQVKDVDVGNGRAFAEIGKRTKRYTV
jgi:hypothetical protein